MKLKFLIFATVLAAMGPGRDAPPPDPAALPQAESTASERGQPRNPARLPPVAEREAPEIQAQDRDMSSQEPGALEVVGFDEVTPDELLWTRRPIVVFADTPGDPAVTDQMRMLNEGAALLVQRDVIVIVDTDPRANSIWRQQLRPSGFSLVVMDKDGQVKQRKPFPWSVREISRAIDRFPLRRQETGRAAQR
ncbi:DUF4174 domain-containing protein [Paracoccus bogoriensis]|uniref:DUF4174 domain-containing protein n=1 Tax=Paracoccus bogoriensis TaxID=242065 RepID=UPI001FE95688|nr:DUF4174 domain-containing protein [Paracoccus bogoriensis]